MYGNILITGGTGTFGNAFTQRVLTENIARRVTILSRDEKKQFDMQVHFGNDPRLRLYLGDVRDIDRLHYAFQGVDIVVHAAALKQVDRSALDIMEFVKTNIYGTMNVINACHDCGVGKAVVLSTDKAVASSTPYGGCKYIAESYAVAGNVYGSTRIAATRYGNIVGSRGCVLEIWQQQYAAGKPLTITDENMTRFWLTIDEAIDLVLLALERTGGGEVFIPKNVKRGRVIDFAKEHFPDATFEIIGKRALEKMHEQLVAPEEVDRLRDAGDVYVLLPHLPLVRWQPGPWGAEYPSVPSDFQYRSDLWLNVNSSPK